MADQREYWLDCGEAARASGTDPETLRARLRRPGGLLRLRQDGLEGFRVGRVWRFRALSREEHLAALREAR